MPVPCAELAAAGAQYAKSGRAKCKAGKSCNDIIPDGELRVGTQVDIPDRGMQTTWRHWCAVMLCDTPLCPDPASSLTGLQLPSAALPGPFASLQEAKVTCQCSAMGSQQGLHRANEPQLMSAERRLRVQEVRNRSRAQGTFGSYACFGRAESRPGHVNGRRDHA